MVSRIKKWILNKISLLKKKRKIKKALKEIEKYLGGNYEAC